MAGSGTEHPRKATQEDLPEEQATLWQLLSGPLIWALHFLASYVTGAVWCAKMVERGGALGGARIAVAVYTLLALAGIAVIFRQGLRKARYGSATVPHDYDTAADRHRFLGFATVLLAGLSIIATIYVALSVVFIGVCA